MSTSQKRETPMAAYFLFDLEITDPAGFADYAGVARRLLAEYGGEIVVSSTSVEPLEGDWAPSSLVVARLPTMRAAREFYDSPEYREVVALRDRSATSRGVLVESD